MTKTVQNETHKELQDAFKFFNKALFKNELPHCLITLNRKSKMAGFYVNQLWAHTEGVLSDEITINPDLFAHVPLQEIMQTLVHEMAHCWQFHFGKPSRSGYHNQQWAKKMEDMGLMPSSTGKEGGKKVGQKMADYAIEGGPFLKELAKLEGKGFKINWTPQSLSRPRPAPLTEGEAEGEAEETKPKTKSKVKFTCPGCGANAWGKPSLMILCGADKECKGSTLVSL